MFINKNGQSILEYAAIVLLAVAALSAMQLFMKRGIQAAIKVAADELAPQRNAELVMDINKGGYLAKSDSATNTEQSLRQRGFGGAAKNYVLGEKTSTLVNDVYIEGEMKGEFENSTRPRPPRFPLTSTEGEF